MDQVEPLIKTMNCKNPGLYFINSENYFPTRGNGWYSNAVTTYLLDDKLITRDNVQYVVYSSLKVDKNYFKSFIDEAYSLKDGYEKLKKCVIGTLKPTARQNFKTFAIGTDLPFIIIIYVPRLLLLRHSILMVLDIIMCVKYTKAKARKQKHQFIIWS